MPEHELWLTALFNDHLAGVANAILGVFNVHAESPARPWENWIVMGSPPVFSNECTSLS
jgi:hypothetical protein